MGGVTETGANSPFECTCSGRSTEKFRSDTLSCDSSIAAISVSIWAFLMTPSCAGPHPAHTSGSAFRNGRNFALSVQFE